MPEPTIPQSSAGPQPSSVQGPPGMVCVPAGTFLYGRDKQERTLPELWIDVHPVTNREYQAYVAERGRPQPPHWPPSGLTKDMLDLPVVNVTFAEAEAYAQALGKRLPTPAEFEKAARGADGRKYPWGETVGQRTSNTKETGIGKLTPVDKFPNGRSPFGCLDMNGNVLHWTTAIYDPERGTRVLKGCSFRTYLGAAAWAYEAEPNARQDSIGFRCVWTPG